MIHLKCVTVMYEIGEDGKEQPVELFVIVEEAGEYTQTLENDNLLIPVPQASYFAWEEDKKERVSMPLYRVGTKIEAARAALDSNNINCNREIKILKQHINELDTLIKMKDAACWTSEKKEQIYKNKNEIIEFGIYETSEIVLNK